MDVSKKRTVVLTGHAGCGKTSLAESMLFNCGAISRKGDVMQGTTVSDFNDDEKERTISINSSYMTMNSSGHQVQAIDTPGYMDFIGETVAAISVADAAVVVVDAVDSVGVVTEEVWQRLDALSMPRVVFINKADKSEAHVDDTLKDIREQLSNKAVVIDMDNSDFVEAIAESDDALLEKYLESGELSKDEIKNALKKSVLEAKVFPVVVGDALSDKGVKELIEAIIAYLPSPAERNAIKWTVGQGEEATEEVFEVNPDGPFVGFIFKSFFDAHLGQLSLMRVFSGNITSNTDVFNSRKKGKEHIGNINSMQGKEQSQGTLAECGDIVALPKLKEAHVSDTLCAAKTKIVLPTIDFPKPSISASIKPKTRADEEKISTSLHRLTEEDHTFQMNRNVETKELIISGTGDLHLKIMVDRMKKRYNLDVELGKPKVTYRETITRPAESRHKYKKQSGGRGQYGDVKLEISPLPLDGEQYEFNNKIFGGAIPKNYIPSVEKGVKQAINQGVLAGYHLDHVSISVTDGSYHAVDSSDMAFQIAGALAFKEAVKLAGPILLEPIMEVAIVIPGDLMGQISGDISSRRGRILGTESRGKKDVIKASVPLSEMSSYATDLRSMTGGRGSYSMKMSHYEQAPQKTTDQVIAERDKAQASS